MEYIDLIISVDFSDEFLHSLVELNKKISSKHKLKYMIDGENFFPHITLYSLEVGKDKKDEVIEKVSNIALSHQKFTFKIKPPQKGRKGFIISLIEKNNSLTVLHQTVVQNLNTLREGHIEERYHIDTIARELSDEEKSNINTFGRPDVFEYFDPHFIITALEDETKVDDVLQEIDWNITSQEAATITVDYLDKTINYKKATNLAKFNLV